MAERTNPHANLIIGAQDEATPVFEKIKASSQSMAEGVKQAAKQAAKETQLLGDEAEKSHKKMSGLADPAVPAAQKFQKSTESMIRQVRLLNAELEFGGRNNSAFIEKKASIYGADALALAPYLAQLKQAEAAQRVATTGLDHMGMSAKQTTAALRQVPMQFTDIVVSLQGGQSAMQVFLQQGGQLRDMFGGAGNAARALGGYVLGLVNPFTVAAAAVAGIAVAYNQGAKEADAYRAALVTTGNAAGTNAAQLKSYAQEISSVVGTQGKAAEALSALAATGKVGAENLREAAQAAVAYERATGQAASKTAEQFAALRNEPLSAVLKLNDGMNFLTESTYRQIKSLEEQGKTAEAANVAQRDFADTLSGRAGEMERNLGTVERGWLDVKDAAKSAWDAILNVGRASTSVDQLAEVRKQIAQRENQIANGGFGTNEGGAAFGRPSQAATERLRAELAGLQAKAAALEGVAYATRVSAEEERKRGEAVKAGAAFDKAGEKFLSDKIRMERELAAARVQGAEAGRSQAEIEKRLGEIRASYAKKGGGGVAAENKELRDQQRIFAELAGVSSTYYAELANAQKQRAAGVITEQQYVTAVQSLIEKQPFAVALAKEEAAATQALSKAYAEAAAERIKTIQSMERAADGLQSQNDALREEIELIGLSAEQQTLVLQQRNDVIILTKEATLAELERQSAITGTQTRVEIALASEIAALKERNALLGAKGVKNAAVDAAKTAADEWQKTTDKINDTLTDALMRGFESGKDFAKNLRDTVVNMFKTMVLRPIISAVVNPVAGAVTGALGLSGAANAASGASGGASMLGNVGSLLGAGSSAFGIGASYGATSLFANGLGSTLSAGSSMIGAGSTMSGLGTMAGALGPIALGLGALFTLIKKFDDSGTPHIGAGAVYSEAGGLQEGAGIYNGQNFGMGMAEEYAKGTQEGVSTIARSLTQTFDGIAKAFGKTAGYEIATAFADDSSKDGAWGSLRISKDGADLLNWDDTRESKWAPREFANGEEGYKEYLAAIAKDTRTVLLDMDLPSWADTMLESIGDAANMDQLAATVQQIGVIQTTFVQLGKTMEGFAGLTDKAFEALMRASGGFESLAANAGTYYENFYSEAEKTAAVTRSVSDALAQVGVAMPATRDEFRALVESQLALGESGAEAVAALLGVSGAFASVTSAAQDAVAAEAQAAESQYAEQMRQVADAANERQRITDGLLSDQASVGIALLRAMGKEEEAVAAERAIAIKGMDAYQTALYDSNQSIRAQIDSLALAAEAMERMAEISRTLASELPAVLDKFLSPDQRLAAGYTGIASDLSKVGINVGADALAAASLDQIAAAAMAVYNLGSTSDETRLALVRAVSGIKDLRDAALDLQATAVRTAATAAGNALGARNNAGSLLDRIDGATGGKGDTYSRMREAELWAALQTASYQQQIDLSGELTGLVLDRYQVERDAARQQLDYAKQLKDYVSSLTIGSLSPKTMSEKLAEAGRQYQDTLGLAQGGDKDAQGRLQGASNAYLELARQYYASSDDYTAIFESVTGSLSGLGDSLMTDAGRQLSVSSASLDELKSLRGVLEGAYATAQQDYLAQQSLLAGQLTALQAIEGGIAAARDIVQGLPALLAAQLQQQSLAAAGAIDAALTKPIAIKPDGADLPIAIVTPAPIDWSGYQQGNDALVAEVKALREEVKQLREERKAHDQVIVQGTVAVAEEHARRIVDGVGNAVQQGLYQASISKEATYK